MLIFIHLQLMADPITGYWKAYEGSDDNPSSIIGIYEKDGKYFGRIVVRYDEDGNIAETLNAPIKKTEGILNHPPYSGLDVIYNAVSQDNDKYKGKVIDPESGRVYDAVLWREDENLILRGEMSIMGHAIGRNNTWKPALDTDFPSNFSKPDLSSFIPKVPEPLKKR